MKALVLEEAYRPIQIREGGEAIVIPVIQAAMRSLAVNAAKGKPRAQKMLFEMAAMVDGERRRDREKLFEAFLEHKLHWEAEIASARRRGVPEPSPCPIRTT